MQQADLVPVMTYLEFLRGDMDLGDHPSQKE